MNKLIWRLLPGVLLAAMPALGANNCRGELEDNAERFLAHDDGTVEDQNTERLWKRCIEDLRGERCEQGRARRYTLEEALRLAEASEFAGYHDWRLPNPDELTALVEADCQMPAIDLAWFPNTPARWFWTASPDAERSPRGILVGFAYGDVASFDRRHAQYVRLVRTKPEPTVEEEDIAQEETPVEEEPPLRTLEGTISDYQCGDNCYLTIIDAAGEEWTGLCIADACMPWNENAVMPDEFRGRAVRIQVSQDSQYDAAGNVMGTMDAFAEIEFPPANN